MTFNEWAYRWGVSPQAMQELLAIFIHAPTPGAEGSESHAQSLVRLDAARHGVHLWRNNVGAGVLEDGSFLRWGLANDSQKLNERLKSGDLVGWRPVVVLPEHVGKLLAVFVSREVKRPGWSWTGTPAEEAQMRWAMLINAAGGDAKIVTGPGSF